jgi:hypothetical protein
MFAADISGERALKEFAKDLENVDTASWRTLLDSGERDFRELEMAALQRFIRRMTGMRKKLKSSEQFTRDHSQAIYLWSNYIEAGQTSAQPAKGAPSLETYKDTSPAASLEAAREELNKRIETDAAMREFVRRQRQKDQLLKNFDFSSDRQERGKIYKEGPLRPGPSGKFSIQLKKTNCGQGASLKQHNVANLMKVDGVPISSSFVVKVINPKPASDIIRKDPNLGKHMVKRGRESPLRQSIALSERNGLEQETHCLKEQLEWDMENLYSENWVKNLTLLCPNFQHMLCRPKFFSFEFRLWLLCQNIGRSYLPLGRELSESGQNRACSQP